MPRKRLKSLIDLTREMGCEPGEYLATRLKHYIDEGDERRAERLATDLIPYTRSKLKLTEVTGEDGGPLKIRIVIGGDDGS